MARFWIRGGLAVGETGSRLVGELQYRGVLHPDRGSAAIGGDGNRGGQREPGTAEVLERLGEPAAEERGQVGTDRWDGGVSGTLGGQVEHAPGGREVDEVLAVCGGYVGRVGAGG